jgi:hypothetical protein
VRPALSMRNLVAIALFCLTACVPVLGQSSERAVAPQPATPAKSLSERVPPAKPDDVKSIDAILRAIYDVISGPAGARDWNRFRSLFPPEGRLTSTAKGNGATGVRLLTVDDYVGRAGKYFTTHAFYECAIVNRVQRYGDIAQVFSSYESRNAPGEKPFTRGINSFQLFYDGTRWWVLSILWDDETPSNPLPPDMATRSTAPITN